MKYWGILFIMVSGCTAGVTNTSKDLAAPILSTVTYTCENYFSGEYNSMADCEAASYANCTSQWQTFPNGGLVQCFTPVTGWESCVPPAAAADWIYSPSSGWNYLCQEGGGNVHRGRSLIGCSSDICVCSETQSTYEVCTPGAVLSDGNCVNPGGLPTCE